MIEPRRDYRKFPHWNGDCVVEMWNTNEQYLDEMVGKFREHVSTKYPGMVFDVGVTDIMPKVWGRDAFIVLTARRP